MKQCGRSYNLGLPATAAEEMLAGAHAQPGSRQTHTAQIFSEMLI